jgi:hypothetical protein
MNSKRVRAQVAAMGILGAAIPAAAQVHATDIILSNEQHQITTRELSTLTGEPGEIQRVFPAEFGEFPNWTNDPGFDSLLGAFGPGQEIGFDILAALRVWDGEDFDEIPLEEQIEIRKGAAVAVTPAMDVRVAGFAFGDANGGGVFHHHIGYTLTDPAATGVYLLQLELWTPGGAIGASEPFWIVFNQNESPAVFEEAMEWALLFLGGCYADCDGSGGLDVFDFLCFQDLFVQSDPRADCDGSGGLDVFDFLCFQDAFVAGCS